MTAPHTFGLVPPGRLRATVRRYKIELALNHAQLAQILGCTEKTAGDWLTYNTTPCASVLLAAERWVWDLNHPKRECPICGGSGQIAAHDGLIGGSRIPCGACAGKGVRS